MKLAEKISCIKDAIVRDSYLYFFYEKADSSRREFLGYIKEIQQIDGIVFLLVNGYIESKDEFSNFTIRLDRIISLTIPLVKTKTSMSLEKKASLMNAIISIEGAREEFFNQKSEDRFLILMNYYIEAQKSDRRVLIPSRKLIKGIDLDILSKSSNGYFELDDKQFKSLYTVIKNQVNAVDSGEWLYINELSLRIKEKVFVIAYHDVFFDVEKRLVRYDDSIEFNGLIFSDDVIGTPFRLKDGFNVNDFTETYLIDKDEALAMLEFVIGSLIDTSPLCLSLEDSSSFISSNLGKIITSYQNGFSSAPVSIALGLDYEKRTADNFLFATTSSNDEQLNAHNMIRKNTLSYIFGPPGTGKSYTIIEMVISAILKGESVLVSANANHPLDEIAEKLNGFSANKTNCSIPYFRIGNINVMCEEIDRIRALYRMISGKKTSSMRRDVMLFNESMTINYSRFNSGNDDLTLFSTENVFHAKMLENLTLERLGRIHSHPQLERIIFYEGDSEEALKKAVKELSNYCKSYEGYKDFIDVFPIVLSTAYSTSKLPAMAEIFDIVFLDEAASCPVVSGLLPLFRGKKAVLLGDESQLKSFSIIEEKIDRLLLNKYKVPTEFSFANKSILEIAFFNEPNLPRTMLKKHYRCQEDIIGFCNREFYDDQMTILTKSDGKPNHLFVVDISSASGEDNSSITEAEYILNDIIERELDPSKVAIITPFIKQVEVIKRVLKSQFAEDEIRVGTVHSFQGDQNDNIYFSLAINQATSARTIRYFVSNKHLVNVAISRARNLFVAAGDFRLIALNDDNSNVLYKLMNYSKQRETFLTLQPMDFEVAKPTQLKQRIRGLTYTEVDFKRVISQVVSVFKSRNLTLKSHVMLANFFPELEDKDDYRNFHFDFVVADLENRLYVALELDGVEHSAKIVKIINDLKKDSLLIKYPNLKIVRVNNSDRNQYVRIKQLIASSFESLSAENKKPQP